MCRIDALLYWAIELQFARLRCRNRLYRMRTPCTQEPFEGDPFCMSSVEERVTKLICEQLGVKEEEVKGDASFVPLSRRLVLLLRSFLLYDCCIWAIPFSTKTTLLMGYIKCFWPVVTIEIFLIPFA